MKWRHLPVAIVAVVLAMSWHSADSPGIVRQVAHVVVLGDSVANGAGDEGRLGIAGDLRASFGVVAENLGMNGARTYDVTRLLRTACAQAAIRRSDAILLSIGGNDLFGDRIAKMESLVWPSLAMDKAIGRVDRLVRVIHDLNPSARIYLLGLYNPYRSSSLTAYLDRQVAQWDSRLVAHFANQPAVDVVRIADLFAFTSRLSSMDHFHPGRLGYLLIAQRVAATW